MLAVHARIPNSLKLPGALKLQLDPVLATLWKVGCENLLAPFPKA